MAGLDRRGCFKHHKNTETGFCLYIGTSLGAISLFLGLCFFQALLKVTICLHFEACITGL